MTLPLWLRAWLHRRGWLASPALAYLGYPFGPDRRDLAGEVSAAIARGHDLTACPVCRPEEPDPAP